MTETVNSICRFFTFARKSTKTQFKFWLVSEKPVSLRIVLHVNNSLALKLSTMNNPLLHFLRSVLRHVSPPFGGSWRGASLRRVMSYPLFRRGIGGGFFLFFILSCGDGERASFLRQAEAQLPEHPDSAQTLLNRVGNPYELSDDNRAWYGLLRTWTDNLLTSNVKSDTLLRDSYL